MSTELAMNAYVLLGNALNSFVNAMGAPPESGIDPQQARDLYMRFNPMIPAQIEAGVASLGPREKATLSAVCRYIVLRTPPGEAGALLGLPAEVVEQTLAGLGL